MSLPEMECSEGIVGSRDAAFYMHMHARNEPESMLPDPLTLFGDTSERTRVHVRIGAPVHARIRGNDLTNPWMKAEPSLGQLS